MKKVYVLLLLAAGACARIPDPVDPLTPSPEALSLKLKLDETAPQFLAQHGVPSVGVAYISDGRVQWSAVYGEQAPGAPATPATLYNIASMTKPLVAETVLRLVSKQALSLDEQMSAFWIDPDLTDDNRHELLTPRIALQHRTGFTNWRSETGGKLTFTFDPGSATHYSGEGFNYLGRFIEEKLGRPFEEVVGESVFAPLGMIETTFVKRDWTEGRVAMPKGPDGEWGESDIRDDWNAADDVHTTPEQYAHFLLSVMNDDAVSAEIAAHRYDVVDNQLSQGCPLPAEFCPKVVGFGLCWQVFEYENERVVMHSGSDWGEKAFGYFIPHRGIGVVIFTNGAKGMKVVRDVSNLLNPDAAFTAFLDLQAS